MKLKYILGAVILGFFIAWCMTPKDDRPATQDLKIYGHIDSNLSAYSIAQYTLKDNRRGCKSYRFELFNGGFNLRPKVKTLKSYLKKQSDDYELTIPLSKMDKDSDCRPSLDYIQLCIFEGQGAEQRCKYGAIHFGGTELLCLGKTKEVFPSCNSRVRIFDSRKAGSRSSVRYQSNTVDNLGFESGLINCSFPRHDEHCQFKTSNGFAQEQAKKFDYNIDIVSTNERPDKGRKLKIKPNVAFYKDTKSVTISWGHVYGAGYYAIKTPEEPCYEVVRLPLQNFSHRFASEDFNWLFRVVAIAG